MRCAPNQKKAFNKGIAGLLGEGAVQVRSKAWQHTAILLGHSNAGKVISPLVMGVEPCMQLAVTHHDQRMYC